jgi:hypothetical protein
MAIVTGGARDRFGLTLARSMGRQAGEAFGFCQGGKRHEMHDDAARKPHGEEQAERDTQPAMQQSQRAHHGFQVHHLVEAAIS